MSRLSPALLGGALLLTTPALAQHHLYLDPRVQFEAGYAEGWLRGFQATAVRVVPGNLSPRPGVALRLRGPGRWSASLDYAVGKLDFTYVVTPPPGTANDLLQARLSRSLDLNRLSVLAHYRLGRLPDPAAPPKALSLGWELVAGAGLNHIPLGLKGQRSRSYVVSNQDTVMRSGSVFHHAWGAQLTAGLTTRLYRLGRERAFLSLYLTQGLTDLLSYDTQYSFGGAAPVRRQVRGRGSALGFTLGLPLRLHTWPAKG